LQCAPNFYAKQRYQMNESGHLSNLSIKPDGYFKGHRNEMIDFLPVTAETILDVGCGVGNFGSSIKSKMDVEIWGIEIDKEAAQTAITRYDNVLVGDISEIVPSLPVKYFDCIFFNDVLEHLVNPYEVLQNIKANLAPSGVVICSIPNVRHYKTFFKLVFRRQWEYEDMGVLDRTHLRFFTEKSIKDMFNMLDYEIVNMKGIHRTRKKIPRLINLLTFGWLSDTLYLQYVCEARPIS
jgi:2-polyprenyl-3-methyl-5-hydroxy-6-metoxy-1,4-benzoquinol methylase